MSYICNLNLYISICNLHIGDNNMAMGKYLTNELTAWGILGITLVVVMIVLNKFKSITGSTTTSNTTVDDFVTGLAEPKNWVTIVVIAVVGFGVIKFIGKKSS